MVVVLYSSCPLCGKRAIKYPFPVCTRCEEAILREPIPEATILLEEVKVLSCRGYDGAVKNSIKYFKYRNAGHMMRAFERAFEDFVAQNMELMLDMDFVVSVPMHPTRQKKRTFNQSEV